MPITVPEAISDLPPDKARVFKQSFDGQGRDPAMSLIDYLSTILACPDPWLAAFPSEWNSEASYSKVRTAMTAMMQSHPECVPAGLEDQLRESFRSKNIQKILEHRRVRQGDTPDDESGDGSGDESGTESGDDPGDESGTESGGATELEMKRSMVIRTRDACMRWANQNRSEIHDMLSAMWGPSPAVDLHLETPQQVLAITRMVVNGAPMVSVLEYMTERYA